MSVKSGVQGHDLGSFLENVSGGEPETYIDLLRS